MERDSKYKMVKNLVRMTENIAHDIVWARPKFNVQDVFDNEWNLIPDWTFLSPSRIRIYIGNKQYDSDGEDCINKPPP